MIENCGSNSHQNAMADSTVGTMKGISTTARMIALNGRLLVQQQREIKPDREFNDAGDGRVEKRVEDRQPERRVVPQPFVILEADENAVAADAARR